MSSLFSARRSPAARIRASYRRYRSTPRHSLLGPLLLALAIAGGGHQLAAAHTESPLVTAASSASVADPLQHRLSALLGEPVAPNGASVRARAVWGADGDGLSRTPTRASRAAARTAVAKPKPKPRKPRWVRPSGGPLTSPYGSRWGRMHRGLDFGAGYGSPVRAAFDGVVVSAGYDGGGYGRQVRIRHAGGVVTTYSHLSRIVVGGGRVKAGDVIGKVGSSGNSTGPHLHFEVLVGGANVNPRPFLRTRGVSV